MNSGASFPIPNPRRFQTVLLALVAGLLLIGCNNNKSAIQTAMNQYQTASMEFYSGLKELEKSPMTAGLGDGMSKAIQHYADQLRAINISGCPQDFRVAFVRYYQAVDGFKGHIDSTTGWRGVLKGFLNPMAIFSVPDNTDKAMKPLDEAGKNLVLVCTKYGFQFK